MSLRFAFAGFRHAHIESLYDLAQSRKDIEIVAACEEDADTRSAIREKDLSKITHDNFEEMLDEVGFDVLAVGDYYEKRGRLLIEGLKRGRHVLADKPLCTRLSELDEIEALASEKGLSVGCMLDMRVDWVYRKIRDLILAGDIGEVHAISFDGQHPLNYGSRPSWYFEEGKHGGTFNDIGIHAVDYIPWATGLKFISINAARNWNACLPQVPSFLDSSQAMLTLENGCGVLGDVSYLTPNSFGYNFPHYWRMTFWGQDGVIETSAVMGAVKLYKNGETEPRTITEGETRPGGYLDDLLLGIKGDEVSELSTATVIDSTRIGLKIQQAADEGLTNVKL